MMAAYILELQAKAAKYGKQHKKDGKEILDLREKNTHLADDNAKLLAEAARNQEQIDVERASIRKVNETNRHLETQLAAARKKAQEKKLLWASQDEVIRELRDQNYVLTEGCKGLKKQLTDTKNALGEMLLALSHITYGYLIRFLGQETSLKNPLGRTTKGKARTAKWMIGTGSKPRWKIYNDDEKQNQQPVNAMIQNINDKRRLVIKSNRWGVFIVDKISDDAGETYDYDVGCKGTSVYRKKFSQLHADAHTITFEGSFEEDTDGGRTKLFSIWGTQDEIPQFKRECTMILERLLIECGDKLLLDSEHALHVLSEMSEQQTMGFGDDGQGYKHVVQYTLKHFTESKIFDKDLVKTAFEVDSDEANTLLGC